MKVIETNIQGLWEIDNFKSNDTRGQFVKTFNSSEFNKIGIKETFEESYYSISKKGVIRGMHFQTPPNDHNKLVYVAKGEILDVVIDLRIDSKTYGKSFSKIIKEKGNSLFIPKGFAHGFLSLTEESIVIYNVSSIYNSDSDIGIRWDSFNFNWKNYGITNFIISERDKGFINLENFKSPFKL